MAATGKRIDSIRAGYEQALKEAGNDYERGYVLSCALIDLRQAVKDYMPVLRQLQGSKLGFRTDKDRDGGYAEGVLIDCAIEAVMHGAKWINNEFNIIAGGCYLTKAYWWRKVREIDGLTDLDLDPGIPQVVNGKTVVEFAAYWKLNGQPHSLSRKFSIIVRNQQTDDATIGKAEGRMLKAIYRKLTGSEIGDADECGETKAPAQATNDQQPAGTEIVIGAPAVADRVKCDGNHAAPRCGAPVGLCWQDDPPEETDTGGELFDYGASSEDVERAKLEATR